ncbi:MAG: SusC/RagA family TonB-linked outer membrane protein [Saprospiraceae bacterium]
MKKLSLALMLALFSISTMLAQRTVSGTVTDANGESLIGVSIFARGTTVGTVTDIDGTYSLEVPDGVNTLVFSYTGFKTEEIALGASNVIDLTMQEATEQLAEVVVTGLGIRKEKKALGYGVTTLGSADVELKPEADIARVLRGKVPGVDITSTSGLAGSGTNVIIRGYSSITGDNQPLFVVDGVPFNADTNSDRGFGTGGATASSRFLDLDPNNIAEVSILKGLSATVLYGEAGRNGVVLVTTKSGDAGASNKKFEVTLDQSVFGVQAASIPDDQDRYGNGWQNFAAAAFSNWGAPFDQPNKNGLVDGTIKHPYDRAALNDVFPELIGARYQYKAYDNLQNFFGTGTSSNTSMNISSSLGRNSSLSFSYGYLRDEGYIPNNNFKKHNFGLGIRTQLANKLSVTSSFNFTTSDRNSPPATPIYSSNPWGGGASLFSNVLYTPRSVSIFDLAWENPITHESIYYRGDNIIQHPLWTEHNINDNEKIRRFFGTTTLAYDLTDWLSVSYRLGLDTYSQQLRYTINKGGVQVPDGLMTTSERLNFLTDHTFNISFDKNISDDLNIDGDLGFNMRRETRDYTWVNSTQQFIYGLFTHGNFVNNESFSFFREENTLGAYLSTTLGFRNYLYLNLQARNDWTSTLESANRSILYPSASLSFVPTDAIAGLQNSDVLNYLKLRVGYGTSAGYPDPYQTRNILQTATRVFQTNGGTILNLNSVDSRLGNSNLKPEKHREIEIGVESRLWKNRVGIDLSVYRKNSDDLIIDLELDPATGFTNTTVNAASIKNEGIELGLNFRPIASGDFFWDIGFNFTANENTVESLAEGSEQILIDGLSFLGNFAIPGQPFAVIQGSMIKRTADGIPIIGSDGTYQQASEIGIIGDPNPDYNTSTFTTISYKGLSFRMQWDYVHGGDIWASTPSTLYGRGILQETGEFDRFVPVIVPGVKQTGTDGEGNPIYAPNDIQITPNQHFWHDAGVFYDENRMFDGTTLRLREVSLSYDLPAKWLENSPFGALSLTFSGQNLWFKSFNIPDGANFDPEVLSLGVGNGRGFDFVTGPTSKKFGGSLRITF